MTNAKSAVGWTSAVLLFSAILGPTAAYARTPRWAQNQKAESPAQKSKAAPADGCSMLPSSLLDKTLGRSFGKPSESKWPPAYGQQPWGSNCQYSSRPAGTSVDFIVYIDASPQAAKQTFESLKTWFPPASMTAGIGDSAYIDKNGAIHVLKGKVRYFISMHPANEAHLKAVAAGVATRLATN
jgi:hypothetical protein